MGLLEFLGLGKKKPFPVQKEIPKDILFFWEDDYLMVELSPIENLDFIIAETKRIDDFGKEHATENGFTDITVIGDRKVNTIDKNIPIEEIENIIKDAGITRLAYYYYYPGGVEYANGNTWVFGTTKYGVMCEHQDFILQNIWLIGHTQTEEERQQLASVLFTIALKYNLMGVNWFRCIYTKFDTEDETLSFVNESC